MFLASVVKDFRFYYCTSEDRMMHLPDLFPCYSRRSSLKQSHCINWPFWLCVFRLHLRIVLRLKTATNPNQFFHQEHVIDCSNVVL